MHKSKMAIYKLKNPLGFTLLEILVAIFIFSIVVTIVFGSYNSIFSNAEAISKSTVAYEMGKNCLYRMGLDFHNIYVTHLPEYRPPDIDDPPDPYRVVGDTSEAGDRIFGRIRFTSLSHLPLNKDSHDGIAEIVYYVQTTKDQDHVLRRRDNLYPYPAFKENGEDPVLCRNVLSLRFKYYDAEGEEFDTWDSEDSRYHYSTPRVIGIQLTFGDAESPLYFETKVLLPVFREKIS
ncbi:MAG: prepilin-type N-terminal cleavage/methylation domain-containing protein [Deltaproteobacteria bacterium]|nr:prepilin-type N-terminal cleavage/methylation domain-containing protein [Deltaproteobacteria bacterium]MBW2151921.1 prepilin-type N-terminal cleavage/methylation domain-containing protein [Deltaproteobacteria bacterium]